MSISSWLCTNSTKNMVVKVVHPGGHVELHDRPVLAAEIMLRNPKCMVAYPHVFQQPWAVLAPETTLTLGKKYFVVPVGTIRKLQRSSFKHSTPPVEANGSTETPKDMKHASDGGDFVNKDSSDARRVNVSKDKCFMSLIARIKNQGNCEDSSRGTRSSSSFASSETKGNARKRNNYFTRSSLSPNRRANIDHWQPNLESITEE